jgi:hypothetical protein
MMKRKQTGKQEDINGSLIKYKNLNDWKKKKIKLKSPLIYQRRY